MFPSDQRRQPTVGQQPQSDYGQRLLARLDTKIGALRVPSIAVRLAPDTQISLARVDELPR